MTWLKTLVSLVLGIALATCGTAAATAPAGEVPLPDVPSDIREPQQRADYIIVHFWDNADSLSAYTPEAVEQAFSNYISVFPLASEAARTEAARSLVNRVAKSQSEFAMFADTADKYLYDPESPIESEDYYILFLNEIIKSPYLDDAAKVRPQWILEMAMKNRPGSRAADFSFVTRDGGESTLSAELGKLSGEDSRLLLLFYDPDCGHCRQVMNEIIANPRIAVSVSDGVLSVLAVYSGDEKDLWKDTASRLPETWTVGYDDGTVYDDAIYNIRTLPTLYLIGADGIVLEKEIKELKF